MDKKTKRWTLWIAIGILVLLVIYFVFLKGSFSSEVISAGSNAGRSASSSYGGMVGSC